MLVRQWLGQVGRWAARAYCRHQVMVIEVLEMKTRSSFGKVFIADDVMMCAIESRLLQR